MSAYQRLKKEGFTIIFIAPAALARSNLPVGAIPIPAKLP
jgi:hypothetical protein